jgi:hypothetical protein
MGKMDSQLIVAVHNVNILTPSPTPSILSIDGPSVKGGDKFPFIKRGKGVFPSPPAGEG